MGPLGDPLPPATPPASSTSTTSSLVLGSSLKIPQWRSARSPETTQTMPAHGVKHQVMKFSFSVVCACVCVSALIASWGLGVESPVPVQHLQSDSGRIMTPHERPIAEIWEHRWFLTRRVVGWRKGQKGHGTVRPAFVVAGESKVKRPRKYIFWNNRLICCLE